MPLDRRLDRWQQAGLIDAATAGAIRAHERVHGTPMLAWAVAGFGALAIGLGLVAIAAANWRELGETAKLAIVFGVLAALFGATAWSALQRRDVAREIAAAILFAAVLAAIVLVSGIDRPRGDTWQILALWIALGTPLVAAFARSQAAAVLWNLAAATAYLFTVAALDGWTWSTIGLRFSAPAWIMLLAGTFALAGSALAFTRRRGQGEVLLGAAGVVLIAGATVAIVLYDIRLFRNGRAGFDWHGIALSIALFGAALAAMNRLPALDVRRWTGLVAISIVAWALAEALATADRGAIANSRVVSLGFAVLFLAYWGGLAWLAIRGEQAGLFVVAFAALCLRLLVLYWQAFGGLMSTGIALIGGGIICLVLAWIGYRLVPRAAAPAGRPPH